jgi:hypothetical protein
MEQRASDALADLIERTHRIPTFAAVVMVDGGTVVEHCSLSFSDPVAAREVKSPIEAAACRSLEDRA